MVEELNKSIILPSEELFRDNSKWEIALKKLDESDKGYQALESYFD